MRGGELGKKEQGGVFKGGRVDTPIHTMDIFKALHGWVFVYEPSGCGFECLCSHLRVYLFFGICPMILLL